MYNEIVCLYKHLSNTLEEKATPGKKLPNKKLVIIFLAVAVAAIVAVIVSFFLFKNNKLTAITMRVLRLEGTVSLEEAYKINNK